MDRLIKEKRKGMKRVPQVGNENTDVGEEMGGKSVRKLLRNRVE